MSNLLVQNIKHTNNTQSIAVDTSGNVTASGTMAVDTIKGNASAGSMTIVGEGGSNTTNLQQGLCKVWAEFGGTSDGNSTITLNDSFNTASLTDNGTGDYTHAYTNNMASIDYVFVGSGQYTAGAVGAQISVNSKSGSIYFRGTSAVTSACKYMTPTGGPIDYDYEQQQFAEFGDLA